MIWGLIIIAGIVVLGWVINQAFKSWQTTNMMKQRFNHLKSLEDRSSTEELIGNSEAADRYAQLANRARADIDRELNK